MPNFDVYYYTFKQLGTAAIWLVVVSAFGTMIFLGSLYILGVILEKIERKKNYARNSNLQNLRKVRR